MTSTYSTLFGKRVTSRLRIVCALITLFALAGCGLRIETENLRAPEPDAVEVIREAMVLDSLTIESAVSSLINAATPNTAVSELLTDISAATAEHLDALGGVYDPGPDYVVSEPEPTPTQTSTTIDSLVQTLCDAANRSRSALETTQDGVSARLYATIATAQYGYAMELAELADIAMPDTDITRAALNDALPIVPNLETHDYRDLVATQDAIGYIREMWGLHATGNRKERILNQAVKDRQRARDLAASAQLVDTDDDPREVFYLFDRDITKQRPARRTITELYLNQIHRFSAEIVDVAAEDRDALLDWMVHYYRNALKLTASPQTFPGLPEYTPDATEDETASASSS